MINCEGQCRIVLVKYTVDVRVAWIKPDLQLTKNTHGVPNLVDFCVCVSGGKPILRLPIYFVSVVHNRPKLGNLHRSF
jgi:hypothetical protein